MTGRTNTPGTIITRIPTVGTQAHQVMGRIPRTLLPPLNNTLFGGFNDWRLPNFKELADIVDLSFAYPYFPNDHQKGSHQIWYSPKRYRLSMQEGKGGKAKGYQVEQFLIRYEVENEEI